MLGLQRGTVTLVPHNPQWAALFTQEKQQITNTLGHHALDIQHIGSTAVPGLDAKPILDIAIAVADLDTIAQCAPLLQASGYEYFGDRYHAGNYFFAKGQHRIRTHYIHMVLHASPEWTAMLRFRDYLRGNPDARQQYSDIKHSLFAQHASNRRAYSDGKAALIQSLLREALLPDT